MSTRATIEFSEENDKYYVYRHCDGFPENVLPDIEKCIDESNDRWSNPQTGCLVTLFLAMSYNYANKRLPYYEITPEFHGDESYKYFCKWDVEKRKYNFGVLE